MRMAVAAQAALLLCIASTRGTPIGSDRSTVARARLHSHSIHNPAAADTTSSLFNSSRSWVKSLFPLSTLWGTALGTGAAEGTLALPGNRSSPPTLFVVEDVSETALGTPEEEGVVGHNLPQIDAASGVQAGGLIPNHGMASQIPRLTVVDAQHVVESRANLTELSEEGAHAAAEAVPEDPSKALELPVARGSKNPVALLEPLHSPPKASSSVAAGNAAAPPGAAITASMSVDYASLPPVLDTFFSGTCATQRMKAGISMRDGVWLSKRLKAVYVPNLKAGMLAIIQYLHAYGPTKKLERVTPETVINLVSSGYKFFTFVRDPLSRMRSAYSETLYHTLKKTGRNHARFMVQMAPGKAQFEEFARSLKCCRKTFVKEIYHADPQSVFIGSGGPVNSTQPRGTPPFAFVGRIENLLERDWRTLLVDHLGLKDSEVLPVEKFHSSASPSKKTKAAAFKARSASVSTDSVEVQKIACEMYDLDYRCYGYPKPVACVEPA